MTQEQEANIPKSCHVAGTSGSCRVLVCGGRDYRDVDRVFAELDRLRLERGITELLEGGASGADGLARLWADRRNVRGCTFSADWDAHGRAAGPKRNARMIAEGKPDLVLAFPGGRGTADCVSRARKAGIEVIEIPPPLENGDEK